MLPHTLLGFRQQGSMILPNTIANERPFGHLPKELMPGSWSQQFTSSPLLLPPTNGSRESAELGSPALGAASLVTQAAICSLAAVLEYSQR